MQDAGQVEAAALALVEEGKQIFRFDTFGDEAFWGDKLKLHQAIRGAKFGGVGAGVSPKTALAVGLKVDMEALPPTLVQQLREGKVDLDDPATTLALLRLDAVLGVRGQFNGDGSLKAVGISCALCHSTVDDAFAPGIGRRLDGWANRDLNVGAIVSFSPDMTVVQNLEKFSQGKVELDGGEVVDFWSRIMADHADFVAHLLDPEEKALIEKARGAGAGWRALKSGGGSKDKVEGSLEELIAFKKTAQKGVEAGQIKSIIHPLLADHVVREALKFSDELKRAA